MDAITRTDLDNIRSEGKELQNKHSKKNMRTSGKPGNVQEFLNRQKQKTAPKQGRPFLYIKSVTASVGQANPKIGWQADGPACSG